MMTDTGLPAATRIGHVHLKVADLDRAVHFCHDILGFEIVMHWDSAALLPQAAITITWA